MEHPYLKGQWKFQKDEKSHLTYFFKGEDPVFLTKHYLTFKTLAER